MSQLDIFTQSSQTASPIPSVDAVRARFEDMLTRLRSAASDLPFNARELAYCRVVTPQRANWLPPAEREALCAEFSGHISQLSKATA